MVTTAQETSPWWKGENEMRFSFFPKRAPNVGAEMSTSHEESPEAYKSGNLSVKVWQPAGLLCMIQVRARVPLSPDRIFNILTDIENQKIFRNNGGLRNRTVVKDDGRRLRVIDMVQNGRWRFLMFSGTFPVHLRVTQDSHLRKINFKLQSTGFMKVFEGEWNIMPYSKESLRKAEISDRVFTRSFARGCGGQQDDAVISPVEIWGKKTLADALTVKLDFSDGLENIFGARFAGSSAESLVTLRQSLKPALIPPPPLDSYVRKISAKITREIIEDLQTEAVRLNALV